MPGLFLTTPGTQATLVSQRVRLEIPADDGSKAKTVREIPLNDIEHAVVIEHIHFSMPLLAELMRRGIPLIMTTHGERVLGLCLPPAVQTRARLAQYRRTMDPRFALALAANWVECKILNSRRVLQRVAANRPEADVAPALAALQELSERCRGAETLETLRGYEGTAAGRYFEAFGGFFPESCPFEFRSRRPPHNAANAILSFAYTLLTSEMECHLHAVGLDPAIGFLHEPADRRPSLALDLVEPFRAPVADALALDLITHSQLKPQEHFEARDGGVYLNKDGRKRFFVAYERRLGREYHSEQAGLRTTLRGEMRRQALGVKQAVLDDEAFEPFLMN